MPDRSVRIGVFGTGFAAAAHLPAYRHTPGAEVVAVFSKPLEDAKAAAESIGATHAFGDWQEMLASLEFDLVDVAVPPFLHHAVTIAALEAGCHVLCEKPMALDLDQASEMLEKAEEGGVIHMVDHQLRFNPTYRRLKRMLDDRLVGRVYHVRWHNVNPFRADPSAVWTWWSDTEMGGGNLMAGASHAVDLVRWLFGEVRAVSGQLATWVEARPEPRTGELRSVTSDDQYSLVLELDDGELVWLFGGSVARHKIGMRLEIVGSEGTIILDEQNRLWAGGTDEHLKEYTEPDQNADLEGVPKHVWGTSFVSLARELVAAVREQRALQEGATFYDGMRTQAVLDAARLSWAQRAWKKVTYPT